MCMYMHVGAWHVVQVWGIGVRVEIPEGEGMGRTEMDRDMEEGCMAESL